MRDYLEARKQLIGSATPGVEAARELSELTDEAVRELSRAASSAPSGRWAIVTLGGWGTGQLLPASDLDLLLLSDASASTLKPFVEELLYPLWDAGLKVGHQVRSPRQQLDAMRGDLTVCTAALSARPIAGDAEWAAGAIRTWCADATKRRKQLIPAIRRRPRPGSAYALEPDLKEGAGGRRDLDELRWIATIITGRVQSSLAGLQDSGAITALERVCAERAGDTIAAARWAIQSAGRSDSKMSLDVATDLAVDPQSVQRAIADAAQVLLRARRRLDGEAIGDQPISAAEALDLLGAGASALPTLEEAAWAGRLDGLVPGFRELLTLRRPGLGHELTVGAHSLKAACSLADLCEDAEGPVRRSCEDIRDWPALRIATLVHDVGKRVAGADHARRGAEPAHDAALAFGLRPSRAQEVADLVRLHLALPQIAMREDLADEDAILRAAAHVARRELVAPLHLLTVADSRATGAATWGPWQDSLVGTLVSRLDAALAPEIDGAGLATRGDAVRRQALEHLDADAPHAARNFVAAAPLRYLAEHDAAAVIGHARLVSDFESDSVHGFRLAVTAASTQDACTVSVVAKDRPELFSRIAGALSLSGLDILSAEAYGATAGKVLDVFTVTSATRASLGPATWAGFERYLRAALRDRLELEARLAERRRHYPASGQEPPEIEVETTGYGTLLRVRAPDRVGLLYDIGRAIASAGLDIRWARVLTSNGIARDTFSVVGDDGEPAVDHGVIGHAVMAIRERL